MRRVKYTLVQMSMPPRLGWATRRGWCWIDSSYCHPKRIRQ